jgi:hypothetical protein
MPYLCQMPFTSQQPAQSTQSVPVSNHEPRTAALKARCELGGGGGRWKQPREAKVPCALFAALSRDEAPPATRQLQLARRGGTCTSPRHLCAGAWLLCAFIARCMS